MTGNLKGTGPGDAGPAMVPTDSMKAPQVDEDKGPLGFLDRLLDSERDSNLHLGDVRFWQHLEHIERNNLYRLSSLEYRTLKMMFFEALLYSLFLFVLTGFIISLRSGDLYESRQEQQDYWAGCRYDQGKRQCSVDNIMDTTELMSWLRGEFVPKAFTFQQEYQSVVDSPSAFTLQDRTMHWRPRYIGDTHSNVLLGAIRVRQLRVQYNADCQILPELKAAQQDCFAQFSSDVQSRFPWAPAWTPASIIPFYQWHAADKTSQVPMKGYHAEYPGDGFFFDLPLTQTAATTLLQNLEDWQWLDQRSRALIVEFSTLNPNTNIFVQSRMLFEFPALGGLVMKHEVFAFRAMQLSLALMATDDGTGVFAYFICITAMHIVLFFYSVFLLWKNGFRYFTFFWSYLDMAILLTFLVYTGIVGTTFTVAAYEPALQPEVLMDSEAFFPLGRLVPLLEAGNAALAWLGLFGWLKILKYFMLATPFLPFVRVVEGCMVNLVRFMQLLIIVLMGFALAFYLGYGDESNLFATIRGSFVAVMVAPAGGVDLSPIVKDGSFLGAALIFFYIIVVFLLLLNTFLAMCVETYSVSSYQINECTNSQLPGEESPTSVFLWTYWNALKGVKLVGKETVEDMGEPDEQRIMLSSLPEAIQERYLETKRRMESILGNANKEIDENKRAVGAMFYSGAKEGSLALEDNTQGPRGAAFALEDHPTHRIPQAPQTPVSPQNPPPPPSEDPVLVHRVQIQRMLDDDPVLRDICGCQRAVDVIRRFKVDNPGVDPYAAVAELQSSVAKKLAELEAHGLELNFDEMETLKQVSTELHSALTDAQKEWRQELLTVMQMASLLSSTLIQLTRKLEAVQENHTTIVMQARLH